MRPVGLTRAVLWERFGPPTDQVGSLNEPRARTEYGVTWNEKWIYRGANGRAITRVVLFFRYTPVGVFRIRPDAGAEPEWLPGDGPLGDAPTGGDAAP